MRNRSVALALFAAGSLALLAASRAGPTRRKAGRVRPPGRPKQPLTLALEAGSRALQGPGPLKDFHVYLVGFHPAKDDPEHQMEAHHFCRVVNEDFTECVLFDGNGPDANMIGVEYIVSERLYARLPEEERPFWHPHDFEILSGTLVGPGLPRTAETALMLTKMNSYGKTWHTWDTGDRERHGDPLPMGEPMLMWSFNRLGECKDWLIRERDRMMGTDTAAAARARRPLARIAAPQKGVNALHGRFDRPVRPLPGVRDVEDAGREHAGRSGPVPVV